MNEGFRRQIPKSVSKILSENDTGDTGTHQAGILVPKGSEVLRFFPTLNPSDKNPRVHLVFRDPAGDKWEFAFIYYNNALFGGTRNEYRLTRMTEFIRIHNLRPGDELILERDENGARYVRYQRKRAVTVSASGVLKLGNTWKVIAY
jgi:hypothetical protein